MIAGTIHLSGPHSRSAWHRTALGVLIVLSGSRRRSTCLICGRRQVRYGFRLNGRWSDLHLECEGKPARPAEGSLEQFITDHYWGYTAQPDGATLEYRVEHEPWRVWRAAQARFDGDCDSLYGPDLAACLKSAPDSAFLAEGSPVAVYAGEIQPSIHFRATS